uniref:Low density lipoprotein receptor-related protein 2b n=1 Tax=Salarias fasciatus TaxID=181472 RepID=A0A672J945_SALFA
MSSNAVQESASLSLGCVTLSKTAVTGPTSPLLAVRRLRHTVFVVIKTCSSSQFTCTNGNCIPQSMVCDGNSDCWDNSDEAPELLCITPQPTCAPNHYMCKSGQCIESSKVCDGHKDCTDDSDEKGINECLNPSVHQCAQICTDTLTSYYCSCNPGYKLMPDGKACEDIDECVSTPSVCSQICENSFGSYYCKCAPGYIREPDGRTCRQNSGISPYLLYSNRYYIRKMNTGGSELSIVLQGLSNVVALEFDNAENRLYWVDTGAGKIERMRFDGKSTQIHWRAAHKHGQQHTSTL